MSGEVSKPRRPRNMLVPVEGALAVPGAGPRGLHGVPPPGLERTERKADAPVIGNEHAPLRFASSEPSMRLTLTRQLEGTRSERLRAEVAELSVEQRLALRNTCRVRMHEIPSWNRAQARHALVVADAFIDVDPEFSIGVTYGIRQIVKSQAGGERVRWAAVAARGERLERDAREALGNMIIRCLEVQRRCGYPPSIPSLVPLAYRDFVENELRYTSDSISAAHALVRSACRHIGNLPFELRPLVDELGCAAVETIKHFLERAVELADRCAEEEITEGPVYEEARTLVQFHKSENRNLWYELSSLLGAFRAGDLRGEMEALRTRFDAVSKIFEELHPSKSPLGTAKERIAFYQRTRQELNAGLGNGAEDFGAIFRGERPWRVDGQACARLADLADQHLDLGDHRVAHQLVELFTAALALTHFGHGNLSAEEVAGIRERSETIQQRIAALEFVGSVRQRMVGNAGSPAERLDWGVRYSQPGNNERATPALLAEVRAWLMTAVGEMLDEALWLAERAPADAEHTNATFELHRTALFNFQTAFRALEQIPFTVEEREPLKERVDRAEQTHQAMRATTEARWRDHVDDAETRYALLKSDPMAPPLDVASEASDWAKRLERLRWFGDDDGRPNWELRGRSERLGEAFEALEESMILASLPKHLRSRGSEG